MEDSDPKGEVDFLDSGPDRTEVHMGRGNWVIGDSHRFPHCADYRFGLRKPVAVPDYRDLKNPSEDSMYTPLAVEGFVQYSG